LVLSGEAKLMADRQGAQHHIPPVLLGSADEVIE
jgi:hypothetical protein